MSSSTLRPDGLDFEDRVARLEEHLPRPTAEEWLERAEEEFARASQLEPGPCRELALGRARGGLCLAKSVRGREMRELAWDFDDGEEAA